MYRLYTVFHSIALTKFECELAARIFELQLCRLGQLSSILREETFHANLYANQLARGNFYSLSIKIVLIITS